MEYCKAMGRFQDLESVERCKNQLMEQVRHVARISTRALTIGIRTGRNCCRTA